MKLFRVELVTIGNEVLTGMVVNTNIAFLAQELMQLGLVAERHTVLSDEKTALKQGLEEIINRSSLVICTGGLGPTCDDCTREVIAEIFHCPLFLDRQWFNDLKNRYGDSAPAYLSFENQATVPSAAMLLPNRAGTAPGLVLKNESCTAIFLPGVPFEMQIMAKEELLPYIVEHFLPSPRYFFRKLHFFKLAEMLIDPFIRKLQEEHPSVEVGIYPSQMLLTVRLSILSNSAEEAERELDGLALTLKNEFKKNYFESPSGTIEEAVHYLLIQQGKTLSLAESCTGGALAARLTRLSGASNYFIGSVTAYCNEVKAALLGVRESTLASKGAVSEETVAEMALGVKKIMKTDLALAVSGIAGPSGGTLQKPVGTVCIALAGLEEKPYTWTLHAKGNRESIINYSINDALSVLLLKVSQ